MNTCVNVEARNNAENRWRVIGSFENMEEARAFASSNIPKYGETRVVDGNSNYTVEFCEMI